MESTVLSLFPETQIAPRTVEPVTPTEELLVTIKAVTLHQPWAWLIGRFKWYETRDWATDYRGSIAIHAAAKSNKVQSEALVWAYQEIPHLLPPIEEIAFGAVVAIADLTDCIFMTEDFISQQSDAEIRTGCWETARYAWKLENVKILAKPITARGGRLLWDWEYKQSAAIPLQAKPEPEPAKVKVFGTDGMPFTKPRYTWKSAELLGVKWWNPSGEEIAYIRNLDDKTQVQHGIQSAEDIPDGWGAVLNYGGVTIPKEELILLNK